MTIRFILNGDDKEISADATRRLLDILRENFALTGTKWGCLHGACGVCSVIFNGTVDPSCLNPAYRVQGSEIITIEGFSKNDEYQDIITGFSQAGLETCGHCDTGKILVTEILLEKSLHPSREDINAAFRGIKCRCTEPESLLRGVLAAGEQRERRIYGRAP
jgi:carbon-monoxide dehydrogenase small subunit